MDFIARPPLVRAHESAKHRFPLERNKKRDPLVLSGCLLFYPFLPRSVPAKVCRYRAKRDREAVKASGNIVARDMYRAEFLP